MNMAALLKAADVSAQRRVSVFAAPAPLVSKPLEAAPPLEPVPATIAAVDFEQGELADLRAKLEQATARLDEQQSAAEISITAAYERGVEDGQSSVQTRDQDRLYLLASALEQGQKALTNHLTRLEPISLKIARAVLDKIIGNSADRTAVMQQMIGHHHASLAKDMVVCIRVSAEDFASDDALQNLSQDVSGVDVKVDPQLGTGQCLFDLKLGRYDASIDLQWDRLQQIFDELVRAEPHS